MINCSLSLTLFLPEALRHTSLDMTKKHAHQRPSSACPRTRQAAYSQLIQFAFHRRITRGINPSDVSSCVSLGNCKYQIAFPQLDLKSTRIDARR